MVFIAAGQGEGCLQDAPSAFSRLNSRRFERRVYLMAIGASGLSAMIEMHTIGVDSVGTSKSSQYM